MTWRSGTRRAGGLALLAALSTFASLAAQDFAPGARWRHRDHAEALAADVRAVVREAERAGMRAGVVAVDDRGRTLFEFRGGEAFIPASNQKIVTAAAFLQTAGVEARFETGLRLVDGVLVVQAAGDPNWRSGTDHDPEQLFATVAREIAAKTRTIREIRIDPRTFVGPRRAGNWPKGQLDRSYCAPSGAVSIDGSRFEVVVRRGGGDFDAAIDVRKPSTGLPQKGRVGLGKGRPRVRLDGGWLDLGGKFPGGKAAVLSGNVEEPELLVARAMQQTLGRGGVRVDPRAGEISAELSPIVTPAQPALERMLQASNNFDAEQLFRSTGARRGDGSYVGSRGAIAASVRELGVEVPAVVRIADGSGLSRDNQLTPRFVASVLRAVDRSSLGPTYLDALPYPGMKGSTMKNRFGGRRDTGLRAKTGTLNGVSALSGSFAAGGSRVYFSILMNADGKGASTSSMRRFQERIVEALRQGRARGGEE